MLIVRLTVIINLFVAYCLCLSAVMAQDIVRQHRPGEACIVVCEKHLTPEVSINVAVRAAPVYEGALLGSGVSALLQRLKIA